MRPGYRAEAKRLGLKHYRGGKKCPAGHVSDRLTSSGECVECSLERHRQSRAADPEKANEAARRYSAKRRAANPEECRRKKKEHRLRNLEKTKEGNRRRNKTYYEKNKDVILTRLGKQQQDRRRKDPEKYRKAARDYYARNLDKSRELGREAMRRRIASEEGRRKQKEYQKEYQKSDAGLAAIKASAHRRRTAAKRGSVTASDIRRLLGAAKKCPDCGRLFSKTRPKHLDHVIPLARGGEHLVENLRVICGPCNHQKYAGMFTSSGQGIFI